MTSITFDTHAYIKKLKEKGATEPLAEAFVDMVKDVQDFNLSSVATKADLRELELRVDNKIEASKTEIIRWMFTGFITLAGLLTALLFKLH